MREIRFGWAVPYQVSGWNVQDIATIGDNENNIFVEQIITGLEQVPSGFDSIWISDHFHPPMGGGNQLGVLEAMTTITYLAAAFPQFDFGSIVLCQSFRNPALLAKIGATLQLLTDGRFIMGIGAGWKEDEYVAYGYNYPKTSVRIAQLEEAVQIVRKMWTETPASFEGKHYHIRDAYCEPKPTSRPPIMIGGHGEQLTLRVVAKYADWCNFNFVDADTYAHKLTVLQRHCESVGRNYDEIVRTWSQMVALGETEAEAKRIAENMPRAMTGTPAQIVEQIQPFIELGVEHFIFWFMDFPKPTGSILFAEEVIPQLRQES